MANVNVDATCIEVKSAKPATATLPTLQEVQRAAEVHRLIEQASEVLHEAHGLCSDAGDNVTRDRINAALEALLLIQGYGDAASATETIARLLGGTYWSTLQ